MSQPTTPPDAAASEFQVQLQRYAELLVSHGVNIQPGQILNIGTEAIHRDFAVQVARAAYQRGAKHVDVDLGDARLTRARVEFSSGDSLGYVPPYLPKKMENLVDSGGCTLRILGAENPDLLSDLPPKKLNDLRIANYKASKYFYDEGINKSRVHWCVASAASPAWAQKIFPDLDPEKACQRLWQEIFRVTRADQENCMELWDIHNEKLQRRGRRLTEMRIEELHFTGPGTDLRVGLSDKAVFCGGSDKGPTGADFEPNIPTEEVFTTPDARRTQGHARATRPFYINGRLIEGLEMEFKDGRLVNFSAKEGEETFREYTASDDGAKRLGEVALVGIDSPIYESGLVFQEILFDENAACHIAVGSAYKTCLKGGESMSDEDLQGIGCNESTVHTDMMISSEEVNVVAKTFDGKIVPLLQNGAWVGDL